MPEVETVLCVDRGLMFRFDGYVNLAEDQVARASKILKMGVVEDDPGLWIDRAKCETMPELKQVIPYVVLRYEGLVGVFRRTEAGSEAKLHRRLTVGVGGHVDYYLDVLEPAGHATHFRARPWDAVRHCIYREINEEVGRCEVLDLDLKGIVNVEENAGVYHVGLVYDAVVGSHAIGKGDGHLRFVGWEHPQSLWAANVPGRLEEWSEAVINGRFKPLSTGNNWTIHSPRTP